MSENAERRITREEFDDIVTVQIMLLRGKKRDQVSADIQLEDLGFDSLDLAQLFMEIEQQGVLSRNMTETDQQAIALKLNTANPEFTHKPGTVGRLQEAIWQVTEQQ